ncbi:MAG: HEPN domain-containing protein [Candidatus Aenigmatarchaeota archaeon]
MKEIKKWLEKAEKDLKRCEVCLINGDFEDCAFHAHQAAEKSLKALYIFRFKRLWKTHDLVAMLEKLKANKNLMEMCEILNKHYIETRYPTETEYTEDIAADALEKAKKVVEWAKENLKK